MISIIIITKNEEKCLPRLLDSIRTQDFNDKLEIIVSDAQSTDKTRKIALDYGCKVIDGGLPSVGRNNGAKITKYPYLLFLDADTNLPNNFLSKLLMEANKKSIQCGTVRYTPISERKADKTMYYLYNQLSRLFQYFYPLSGGACLFCTKHIWEQVGGFDETLLMAEDHNFANKCGKIAKFRFINNVEVFCDVRRLDKEGRIGLFVKYTKAAVIYIIGGTKVKKLPFDYELNGGVNIGVNKKINYSIK